MSHDDDLAMWDDDPVVRALRAPGTPAELAGEAEALAAFRSLAPRRSRRRLARRLGTGAGTLAIAVALSGGVAAAYTHTLPGPVQSVAHGLLSVVGVPAPVAAGEPARSRGPRAHRSHTPSGHSTTPTVADTPVVRVSSAPSPTHGSGATRPSPTPRPSRSVLVVAAGHHTEPASPPPSTSSSPTPAPVTPAAVQGTESSQRIPAGTGVTLTGLVTTASGAPVPGQQVVAQARPAGQHDAWSQVGSGTTDSQGGVAIDVPSLTRTTHLRLVAAKGLHSSPTTVVVVPVLSPSLAQQGARYAVTVTTSGLQPGDVLVVTRRLHGRPTVVHRVAVDGSGVASFFVRVPVRNDVMFHIRTVRTASHAAALGTFVAMGR